MKIAEASKRFDISADTLRYYERIGLLTDIGRTESGIRDYTDENCQQIQFVKCMRNAGVSIEALVEYMQLLKQGNKTIPARKAILEEEREALQGRIDEMQAGLDRLNYKIANYDKLFPPDSED